MLNCKQFTQWLSTLKDIKNNTNKKIVVLFFMSLSLQSFSQLREKQWLIGGNALFSYSKSKELKFTSIQISPAAGYFFKERIATGIRATYSSDTYIVYDNKDRYSTLSLAPFLRYYFLPSD